MMNSFTTPLLLIRYGNLLEKLNINNLLFIGCAQLGSGYLTSFLVKPELGLSRNLPQIVHWNTMIALQLTKPGMLRLQTFNDFFQLMYIY